MKIKDAYARLVTTFGAVSIKPVANATPLLIDSYSLTGANAQALVDVSGTWNTSGTPTGIKLNVLDSNSNASSRLLDLQVGSSTKWNCDKSGKVTQAGPLQFTGTTHGGLILNQLTSAQRDSLTPALGMVLWNSDDGALNYYSPDSDSYLNPWIGVPKTSLEDSKRIFMSRLPNVGTAITLTSNKAYFVYMGRTTKALVVKFVEFYVYTAGSGTQTAEVGLFSTPDPPNKMTQSPVLTKLTATPAGGVDALTSTGVKRNTNEFNNGEGYVVAAGTHLWAGIRTAMTGSQPALAGLCMDYSDGLIVSTASAGALNGAGPWTGALIAMGAYLTTPLAPDLRLTLDR